MKQTFSRKLASVFLTLGMAAGLFAAMPLTAAAAETVSDDSYTLTNVVLKLDEWDGNPLPPPGEVRPVNGGAAYIVSEGAEMSNVARLFRYNADTYTNLSWDGNNIFYGEMTDSTSYDKPSVDVGDIELKVNTQYRFDIEYDYGWSFVWEFTLNIIVVDSETVGQILRPNDYPPSMGKPSAWATESINSAKDLNLVTDEMNQSFQSPTTRAEFCRLIIRMLTVFYDAPIEYQIEARGLIPEDFNDTDDYMVRASASLGITSGSGGGNFSPEQQLTREQAAGMLRNTLTAIGADTANPANAAWADDEEISDWAQEAADVMYSSGIMGGTNTSPLTFGPKSPYTHEQAIITVLNLWNHVESLNIPRVLPGGEVDYGKPGYAGVPPISATVPYGVLIGADPEDMAALPSYQTVVIDAAYFAKDDISKLRDNGSKVYSYLNVGSIETFRDVYPEFESIALDPYDGWPDEFWMDVSKPEWRRYIIGAAGDLANKGVDGFFVDNADVCYQYDDPAIFQGLADIIKELGVYGKDIVINGGDTFVSRAVLDAEPPLVSITGVNQECVFTSIDFDNDVLTVQDAENREYYQEYLTRCREAGLSVYLTEYASSEKTDIVATIADYCGKQGYVYYVAPSVELNGI